MDEVLGEETLGGDETLGWDETLGGDETLGADEDLGDDQTLGVDDAHAAGVLDESLMDLFGAEDLLDDTLSGLADTLEDIDVFVLLDLCNSMAKEVEAEG